MQKLAGIALALLLLAGMPAQSFASDTQLEWVLFNLGGRTVKVGAGGSLNLHPDAPFMIAEVRTDSWLGLGIHYSIKEFPDLDLKQFHTLNNLLGEKVYSEGRLTLQVIKDKRVLGQTLITPRLLPIDWLRRAEDAKDPGLQIEYTKKALDITPDDKLIAKRLVDLLIDARRFGEAAALLEDLAASDSDHEVFAQLAELYQKLEEPDHEAAVLGKLLSWEPGNIALLRRLIELQIKRQRYEEATVLLERLLAKLPRGERAETYKKLAKIQSLAGKLRQALVSWEIAADLEPDNAQLWLTISSPKRNWAMPKEPARPFKRRPP